MPRKAKDPRGGPRELAQGNSSGNRTDLNLHQPITAAPDQAYGVAAQQRAAQRAVPLPQETKTAPVGVPAAGPSAAGGALGITAPATPAPGSLLFDHPSTRPNEPITHGMPFGPGGGPEVLASGPPPLGDTLSSLAAAPNASTTMQELAAAARSLGY